MSISLALVPVALALTVVLGKIGQKRLLRKKNCRARAVL